MFPEIHEVPAAGYGSSSILASARSCRKRACAKRHRLLNRAAVRRPGSGSSERPGGALRAPASLWSEGNVQRSRGSRAFETSGPARSGRTGHGLRLGRPRDERDLARLEVAHVVRRLGPCPSPRASARCRRDRRGRAGSPCRAGRRPVTHSAPSVVSSTQSAGSRRRDGPAGPCRGWPRGTGRSRARACRRRPRRPPRSRRASARPGRRAARPVPRSERLRTVIDTCGQFDLRVRKLRQVVVLALALEELLAAAGHDLLAGRGGRARSPATSTSIPSSVE